jgi:hypothetical protein
MRTITLIVTVAAGLTAATFFAAPASAQRICNKVCNGGVCRSQCVERSDRPRADRDDRRLYLYDRGRDDRRFNSDFRDGLGVEFHAPNLNIGG